MSQSLCWPAGGRGQGPAGPTARAVLLVDGLGPQAVGCGCPGIGVISVVGEGSPEARASLLMGGARDSRAGACPLLCGAGSWGLWLQGLGGPWSSACTLVFGAWSWALWWAGSCPRVAVDTGESYGVSVC